MGLNVYFIVWLRFLQCLSLAYVFHLSFFSSNEQASNELAVSSFTTATDSLLGGVEGLADASRFCLLD